MTRILTMNNKFHNVIKHHELKLIAVLCKILCIFYPYNPVKNYPDYTHRRLGCRPYNGA